MSCTRGALRMAVSTPWWIGCGGRLLPLAMSVHCRHRENLMSLIRLEELGREKESEDMLAEAQSSTQQPTKLGMQ